MLAKLTKLFLLNYSYLYKKAYFPQLLRKVPGYFKQCYTTKICNGNFHAEAIVSSFSIDNNHSDLWKGRDQDSSLLFSLSLWMGRSLKEESCTFLLVN